MTEYFHGRLFGPGLNPSGVPLDARWRNDRIELSLPEGPRLSEPVTVRATGFNHRHLELIWSTQEGSFSLFVEEEPQQCVLLAHAPATLRTPVREAAQRQHHLVQRFRFFVGLCLSVVILSLLGTGLVIANTTPLIVHIADQLPPSEQVRLGELVLAQARSTCPLDESGPAVTALQRIGSALTAEHRWSYRYFVANCPELNAFAAPGGMIVVNRGLIQAVESAEELAGLLAHEIAHAELDHSVKALLKSLGLRAIAALWFGGLAPDYPAMATQFAELKFSRDMERDADHEALRRLRIARIDPNGMARLFERLAARAPSAMPGFLSTHPDLRARIAWLQAELKHGPPMQPEPIVLDLALVQSSLRE